MATPVLHPPLIDLQQLEGPARGVFVWPKEGQVYLSSPTKVYLEYFFHNSGFGLRHHLLLKPVLSTHAVSIRQDEEAVGTHAYTNDQLRNGKYVAIIELYEHIGGRIVSITTRHFSVMKA
jgi:hypothetical protein